MNKFKIAFAELLGFIVLLPACLLRAWTDPDYPSIKPLPYSRRYSVDEWSWNWLNYWYGNSEDGVSGGDALVWGSGANAGKLVWYYSTLPRWVPLWARAYAWSAWRNGANNLKRPLRTDGNNTPWRP